MIYSTLRIHYANDALFYKKTKKICVKMKSDACRTFEIQDEQKSNPVPSRYVTS